MKSLVWIIKKTLQISVCSVRRDNHHYITVIPKKGCHGYKVKEHVVVSISDWSELECGQ